jgi:hypothetical protein
MLKGDRVTLDVYQMHENGACAATDPNKHVSQYVYDSTMHDGNDWYATWTFSRNNSCVGSMRQVLSSANYELVSRTITAY